MSGRDELALDEMKNELEFLRFFHDRAGDVFGPADDDVYNMISDEWRDEGNAIPIGYHGNRGEE